MAGDPAVATLDVRLRSLSFSTSEAVDAIRGRAVPRSLGRQLLRLCVVRGIRYHDSFARHAELQRLRAALPLFSRAINARAIMSNIVPDMPAADDVPYCIWHPDTATEGAYRELVRCYPSMAYQVARACAVAGYTDLYRELDVLPDVSVAEEARACGSQDIFGDIMRSPVKYRVMDDYTRTVNIDDPRPSCLNGDTAVLSSLLVKQGFKKPRGREQRRAGVADSRTEETSDDDDDLLDLDMFPEAGFTTNMFNITEDMNIDETTIPDEPQEDTGAEMAALLARPLPADLPSGNKNVLILAAAFNGDIDRYARLRRPVIIDQEAGCLVRGIYHNPLFATWWTTQPLPDSPFGDWIAKAINARMIMSNDLSRLTTRTPRHHLPYLIWYPSVAQSTTYSELARRLPAMRPAVLRAAVYARDQALFDAMLDEHGVAPDPYVLIEARGEDDAVDGYFARRLLARAEELGLDVSSAVSEYAVRTFGAHVWKRYTVRSGARNGMLPSDRWLYDAPGVLATVQEPGIYDGIWADASAAELFASAPAEWQPSTGRGVELDYRDWPPRAGTEASPTLD